VHYHMEIWFREYPKDVDKAAEKALKRYAKEGGKDQFLDYYTIGGRWSGAHTPGEYNPTKDPANLETCHYCNGTGNREDLPDAYKPNDYKGKPWCNACQGTGQTVRHNRRRYEGDIMSVDHVSPNLTCATLVIVKAGSRARVINEGSVGLTSEGMSVLDALQEANIKGGWLVTADYHS